MDIAGNYPSRGDPLFAPRRDGFYFISGCRPENAFVAHLSIRP
jgi:hypothetical protein